MWSHDKHRIQLRPLGDGGAPRTVAESSEGFILFHFERRSGSQLLAESLIVRKPAATSVRPSQLNDDLGVGDQIADSGVRG